VISEESQSSATSDGSFLALYVHDPGKVVGSILARGFMFINFYLAQYYQDQIGSTRMIRNHNNQLNNLYEYHPYGNALTTYGSESFNYYRFTGAELDKDSSSFYYFPYRYYAPGLQRWMIRDPGGSREQTLYSYGASTPVNGYDRYGLSFMIGESCKGRFDRSVLEKIVDVLPQDSTLPQEQRECLDKLLTEKGLPFVGFTCNYCHPDCKDDLGDIYWPRPSWLWKVFHINFCEHFRCSTVIHELLHACGIRPDDQADSLGRAFCRENFGNEWDLP
jgi:RHS repeat-associated protein